jgi:polyhydroxyalkanoate synthesis regulator phasin
MSDSEDIKPVDSSDTSDSEHEEVFNKIFAGNSTNDNLGRNPLDTLCGIGTFADATGQLGNSYNRLIAEMQSKLTLLESIKKEGEEVEKLKKDHVEFSFKTQQDSLREVVEARQQELVELLDQQIEDLENFEEDVNTVAEKFPRETQDDEVKSLKEKVGTLQNNIIRKMMELRQYKEDIWKMFGNKSMVESIGLINNMNEKLTRSVEQMTKEVTRVQSEVSNFNLIRGTASSMMMSLVTAHNPL